MIFGREKGSFAQKYRSIGLRGKVFLLILVPMAFILVLSSFFSYSQLRDRTLSNMSVLASQTGLVIEHALQRDMFLSDFERIQATFDEIGRDERIRTLYMLDTSGKVIFSPNSEGVGRQLNNKDVLCQPCHELAASERPSGIVVTSDDGQSVFRSMHPIENLPECFQCHDPEQRLIGLLLTDFSIAPVTSALAADLRDNLIWWIGTVVLAAVLANLAINRWVLGRLSRLTTAIEDFGREGFSGELPEEPADEIGRLSVAFNSMAQQVDTRENENKALTEVLKERSKERGYLLKRLISVQEQERKRVARELHDDLGQSLSSTTLNIEIAQRALNDDPQTTATHLKRALSLIAESTDQMYDLILGLRPSVLDDFGLISALRAHCQRTLEPANITFDLDTQGLPDRLPPEIETALFRIFQEALTNVLRHAKASHVVLRLIKEDGVVVGQILDDGVGFDPDMFTEQKGEPHGLGLLGIHERVEQCNGHVEVISNPGGGTCIQVRIPISEVLDGRVD